MDEMIFLLCLKKGRDVICQFPPQMQSSYEVSRKLRLDDSHVNLYYSWEMGLHCSESKWLGHTQTNHGFVEMIVGSSGEVPAWHLGPYFGQSMLKFLTLLISSPSHKPIFLPPFWP